MHDVSCITHDGTPIVKVNQVNYLQVTRQTHRDLDIMTTAAVCTAMVKTIKYGGCTAFLKLSGRFWKILEDFKGIKLLLCVWRVSGDV